MKNIIIVKCIILLLFTNSWCEDGKSQLRKSMESYLKENGWVVGENKANDTRFYVAIGISYLEKTTQEDNLPSRYNAYHKAMLMAKQEMVEFIDAKIIHESILSYREGDLQRVQNLDDFMFWRNVSLITMEKLREIETKSDGKKSVLSLEELEKLALSTEEFMRVTRSSAQAELFGIQPVKVFEGVDDNGNYGIGVVAIKSPRLSKIAMSLINRQPVNKQKPGEPIKDQLEAEKLFTSFGPVVVIDENGEPVVLGFGQEVAEKDNPRKRRIAERKAKMRALAGMAQFGGEYIVANTDMLEVEKTSEFENNLRKYENNSIYLEKIQTASKLVNVSGFETIHTWEGVHPITNEYIVGIVVAWRRNNNGDKADYKTNEINTSVEGSHDAL